MSKRASAFLSLLALGISFASIGAAHQHDAVAFGVLAFGGEQDTHKRWEKVVDALTDAVTDQRFIILPLTLDDAEGALASRELHFLLTNPGHFQNLMVKHELAAIASLRTDAPGRPRTGNRYGAVILVRATKGGPKRLADLKGVRFGAVAPEAFGGWQLALNTLLKNGINPEKDFAELRFFGFPQSSIVQAVLSGEIDAGTVRTGVLESMMELGEIPEDALLVLNPVNVPNFDLALSTALVPEWMVVATPNAHQDLRLSVARALFDINVSDTNTQAWLPPQSLAPVIEIQSSITVSGQAPDKLSNRLNVFQALGIIFVTLAFAFIAFNRSKLDKKLAQTIPSNIADEGGQETPEVPKFSITAREAQILGLVEGGKTTKEIARLLTISPKTVEFHRHNLMKKFDASNMADLVHRSSLLRRSKELGSSRS